MVAAGASSTGASSHSTVEGMGSFAVPMSTPSETVGEGQLQAAEEAAAS